MTEQVRSDHILYAISQLHMRRGNQFFAEVKNGSTWLPKGDLLRIDGLAMAKSWKKPMFTGYEIKISRSDFLRDAKWHLYAEYCHRLILACPKGMIKATEIPDIAGLVWYNHDTKTLTTKKRPVTRDIEINSDMLYYILMSKLEPDRHPYFNSKTEYWQAWLDGKIQNRDLGYKVGVKTAKTISEQQQWEERYRNVRKRLDEILTIMGEGGLSPWPWGKMLDELRQRLSGSSSELPHNVSVGVRERLACADRLAKAVGEAMND